jgi:hypothetical protein
MARERMHSLLAFARQALKDRPAGWVGQRSEEYVG